jgi:hypothetical protein
MLSCKLLSTASAFVLYIRDVNHQCQAMSELCVEPLSIFVSTPKYLDWTEQQVFSM